MPKKTREAKIAAQERKRLRLLSQISSPTKHTQSLKKSDDVVISNETKSIPKAFTEEDMLLKNYFVSDLKKSFLLISSIIALEIAVYFGTINNYFARFF